MRPQPSPPLAPYPTQEPHSADSCRPGMIGDGSGALVGGRLRRVVDELQIAQSGSAALDALIDGAMAVIRQAFGEKLHRGFAAFPAEPVKAEPVKAEPVKAEPVKAEPVKAEPVKDGKSCIQAGGHPCGQAGCQVATPACGWSGNLAAALTALPENYNFSVGQRDGICWAWLQPNDDWQPGEHESRHDHPGGSGLVVAYTAALALISAALLLYAGLIETSLHHGPAPASRTPG